MKIKTAVMLLAIFSLVLPIEVATEVNLASAMFENILATGCLKLYFANGTEILICKKVGEEVIEYRGENVTADVYISASVRVLEYWYDPSTATFHIKLDGIYVDLYYKVNTTPNFSEFAGWKASFKVSGYGLFYSLIDKSHPRPIAMWQVLENGTTVSVDFNCTEGIHPSGIPVWNVTAVIHFSTTEVLITTLLIVCIIILIIAVPVILFVWWRRRKRKLTRTAT